ncbi:MAG: hybrid sensor histidine kinase/response regulator [Bacteroidota bacterium]
MNGETTKGSVLIVDDVPENLQVLGNVLLQKGLDVGFATNGEEALEAVQYSKPDLILLDIMMPGISGITVCQKLKSNPETQDIPVIFLTAKTQPEDIIKGFEVGAVDYVTKPFNSGELLARVMTQLELKKSRDLIAKQIEELMELNATKDKFFSIIAHDLRGPFSGLLGLTDLLSQEGESMNQEEIIDLIKKMHHTLKNQYSLLENLLQWASIQTQRLRPQPIKVNLLRTAKDVISLLQANADKKDIEIINEILPEHNVFVDKQMITSVIHNLLTNAIKFSFEGGKIIFESVYAENGILLKVIDNGVGIPDEVKSKLFKIDKHHSTLGTKNEKGSGLGLILCKEMVEKNGGKIWAERNTNASGTTFFVLLPEAN